MPKTAFLCCWLSIGLEFSRLTTFIWQQLIPKRSLGLTPGSWVQGFLGKYLQRMDFSKGAGFLFCRADIHILGTSCSVTCFILMPWPITSWGSDPSESMGCKWAVKWLFLVIICGSLGASMRLSLFGGLCCALWLPDMNGPWGRSHTLIEMLVNSWHTRALYVDKARIFLSFFCIYSYARLWLESTMNDSSPPAPFFLFLQMS